VPDGLTVDAEGFVWSARWDGGALYRYTSEGSIDRSIPFPARKVSSVTFGGVELTEAYVTTAGGDNKPVEGAGAGALFRFRPGVRGQPECLSRIGL
jgi:D-xylonolactonase